MRRLRQTQAQQDNSEVRPAVTEPDQDSRIEEENSILVRADLTGKPMVDQSLEEEK